MTSSGQRYCLRMVAGPMTERTWPLTGPLLLVGRSIGCHICRTPNSVTSGLIPIIVFQESLFASIRCESTRTIYHSWRNIFRMRAAPHSINRPKAFTGEALGKLMAHEWPGNVRELRNVVERACYIAQNPYIERDNIQIDEVMPSPTVHTENITLDDLERQHLIAMLQRHNNRVVDVAQALGVSRSALYYRLSRHGIRARKISRNNQ